MAPINSDSTPRSEGLQATVQATDVADYCLIVDYVRQAIKRGNRLPNIESERPMCDGPNRKALIIAPLYRESKRDEGLALPSTAHDVKLVHEMLVDSDYDHESIRILCDACRGFNGLADPTKENIIDSLEWLVHDTRPGDYRFLHFSGHGLRDKKFTNDDGSRKEARLVPLGIDENDYRNVEDGDHELAIDIHKLNLKQLPERRTSQKVPETIVYYKEAIMTRLSEPRDGEDPQNASIIWDNELNDHLSKLHIESTITCVMDCCASGRILNLPDKALGAGFRGGSNPSVSQSTKIPVQYLSSSHQPVEQASNQTAPHSPRPPGSFPLPEQAEPEGNAELDGNIWIEELPERETKLNGITANIFNWSGCHQRQNSHDWDGSGCTTGAFTRAFTDAYKCLKASGDFTHKKLYEKVSTDVYKQMAATVGRAPRPQFVQLWTAFKEADEASHERLLNANVVF